MTFDQVPMFPVRVAQVSGLATSDPVHGAVQHAALQDLTARLWVLTWWPATEAVRTAIESVHASTKGGADVMDWTPPGESSIKVRFLPGLDGYRREQSSPTAYRLTVGLQEAKGA